MQQAFADGRFWYTSKKASAIYTSVLFRPGDFLVFGKETEGLPDDFLKAHAREAIRIPIFSPAVRSLNLSTAAGILLYEALRQTGQLSDPDL